jgi:hypothetical protein
MPKVRRDKNAFDTHGVMTGMLPRTVVKLPGAQITGKCSRDRAKIIGSCSSKPLLERRRMSELTRGDLRQGILAPYLTLAAVEIVQPRPNGEAGFWKKAAN